MAAAIRQHRHAPLAAPDAGEAPIDGRRLAIVVVALIALVSANVVGNALLGARAGHLPLAAAVLWAVLAVGAAVRPFQRRTIQEAAMGSVLLLALVAAASLMPVDHLPAPGWRGTLGLGLASSVFDNIPLTKLALSQGGYDWALLSYAVGFGGSMLWFGSSAGVAVASRFPEAESTLAWLRHGWPVPIAFIVGFAVQLAAFGWNP
jgi:Na+/H+ antiporter NhaD/arsenite permease-like protein